MTKEEKKKIIQALRKKSVKMPCPRCQSKNFTLVNGYFNELLQPDMNTMTIGGVPTIPSIVIVCTNCGFLSQHALGPLDLFPKKDKAVKKQKKKKSEEEAKDHA